MAVEILLMLLGEQLIRRVRLGNGGQQVQFELGNGQKQRFGRAQLGVYHVAMALGHDAAQQITAAAGFDVFIALYRLDVER